MKLHISSACAKEYWVSCRLLWTFALFICLSLLSEEIISLNCRVKKNNSKNLETNKPNCVHSDRVSVLQLHALISQEYLGFRIIQRVRWYCSQSYFLWMTDHWRNTLMDRKFKSLKYLLYKLLAWPWNSTRLWRAQYWPQQVFFLRLPSTNKIVSAVSKTFGYQIKPQNIIFKGREVQNRKNRKFFSLVLLGPLTKERDKRKR